MGHEKNIEHRNAFAMLSDCGVVGPILPAFFASPVAGLAVVDAGLRFRAINGTLAAMNGVPAANHISRKVRYVLGSAAPTIESAMEQVLQTGNPIVNLELTAKLPARAGVARWIESYFPIRNAQNRVTHLVAIVFETTGTKNLERSLNCMIGNLLQVGATLRTELQRREMTLGWSDEQLGLLPHAIELAEHCISEAQNISKLSRGYHPVSNRQAHVSDQKDISPPAVGCDAQINWHGRDGAPGVSRLSLQERRVLRLLAECKTNKEVAAELGISVRTGETYRGRVMRKLELHSVAELVRFAIRNKIIDA